MIKVAMGTTIFQIFLVRPGGTPATFTEEEEDGIDASAAADTGADC
jgi:hypothetical protein